jgi:CTP-dependent riboflavin kinase
MIISKAALKKITVRTKNRLALELDCSVPTVDRWIKENEPNGSLTKAKAVEIISQETELVPDQILEESTVEEQK